MSDTLDVKPLIKYHQSLATLPTAPGTHYPSMLRHPGHGTHPRVSLCSAWVGPAPQRLTPSFWGYGMNLLSKLRPWPLSPAKHYSGPSRTYPQEGCSLPEVTPPMETHRKGTPRQRWPHERGVGTSLGLHNLLFSSSFVGHCP